MGRSLQATFPFQLSKPLFRGTFARVICNHDIWTQVNNLTKLIKCYEIWVNFLPYYFLIVNLYIKKQIKFRGLRYPFRSLTSAQHRCCCFSTSAVEILRGFVRGKEKGKIKRKTSSFPLTFFSYSSYSTRLRIRICKFPNLAKKSLG